MNSDKLFSYYLACLQAGSQEGIGLLHHADKTPSFAELTCVPDLASTSISQEEAASVLSVYAKDRARLSLYVGYLFQATRHAAGMRIEPLILLPAHVDPQTFHVVVDTQSLFVSPTALASISNIESSSSSEHLMALEHALGIDAARTEHSLYETADILKGLKPDWPWQDEAGSAFLKMHKEPTDFKEPGLYNRVILFATDRSTYTIGLENELMQLSHLSQDELKGTALYDWLTNHASTQASPTHRYLLEVLPLNTEQREAVEASMTAPLTVITGPPGTGKSQVVCSILMNAAWHGQRVLFASKNNKAVDVVEERVNALARHPLLLRVGQQGYEQSLPQYLLWLLNATVEAGDQSRYEQLFKDRVAFENILSAITRAEDELVQCRNQVDRLDRNVQDFIRNLKPQQLAGMHTLDTSGVRHSLERLGVALNAATKLKQPAWVRMLWPVISPFKFRQAMRQHDDLLYRLSGVGGISFPKLSNDTVSDWARIRHQLSIWLVKATQVKSYWDELSRLLSLTTLEALTARHTQILEKMLPNAGLLWNLWLTLRPANISDADRLLLQKYSTVLKAKHDLQPGDPLDAVLERQYRELSTKVGHLIPGWAVTALSARGRVPFEPALFDLVVFDEASQCDIPSALPLLYRAKRAVVIGDPKQLSHIPHISARQDQFFMQKFELNDAHSGWSYNYTSLFDLAASLAPSQHIISLKDHYRCHAQIVGFSNEWFYEGRLRVATNHRALNAHGQLGVEWIDVSGVSRPASAGIENEAEAQAVVDILTELANSGYTGSLGVVSPFRAQASLIRRLIARSKDEALAQRMLKGDVLVDTVHKFQGDERDTIIFSPVLSEGEVPPGVHQWLRDSGNLFNVAVTRARAKLIVVGDQKAALNCDVPYLVQFAQYVQNLKAIVPLRVSAEDLITSGALVWENKHQAPTWDVILYDALCKEGLKPLPRYQVEKYVLDFALMSGPRMLAIEVDSEAYHKDWETDRLRRDQLRAARLQELGWDVLRLWVYEIRDDLPGCIAQVQDWVRGTSSPSTRKALSLSLP